MWAMLNWIEIVYLIVILLLSCHLCWDDSKVNVAMFISSTFLLNNWLGHLEERRKLAIANAVKVSFRRHFKSYFFELLWQRRLHSSRYCFLDLIGDFVLHFQCHFLSSIHRMKKIVSSLSAWRGSYFVWLKMLHFSSISLTLKVKYDVEDFGRCCNIDSGISRGSSIKLRYSVAREKRVQKLIGFYEHLPRLLAGVKPFLVFFILFWRCVQSFRAVFTKNSSQASSSGSIKPPSRAWNQDSISRRRKSVFTKKVYWSVGLKRFSGSNRYLFA